MADPEHLEILKQGVDSWNEWRNKNTKTIPDLKGAYLRGHNLANFNFTGAKMTGADLSMADLEGAKLKGADLTKSKLNEADLSFANLSDACLSDAWFLEGNLFNANFSGSNLSGAFLIKANLLGANLIGANLSGVNFHRADLKEAYLINANLEGALISEANLWKTNLSGAILTKADLARSELWFTNLSKSKLSGAKLYYTIIHSTILRGADFTSCHLSKTVFSNVDLSDTIGLESVIHEGPSVIDIETLYLSQGKIPGIFLTGCGVPDDFISYIPSLIGAAQTILFYSCFISYSNADEEFAKRLHSRMREARLRVWFAPEDMKGGEKLYDQIEKAIHLNDRLLLILSSASMQSQWVITEIRRALKSEKKEGRRKLFPIRLVDFDEIRDWEVVSSDGVDLAEEIQSYFIPDFSNWKDHDSFEKSFYRLLQDLRAAEK